MVKYKNSLKEDTYELLNTAQEWSNQWQEYLKNIKTKLNYVKEDSYIKQDNFKTRLLDYCKGVLEENENLRKMLNIQKEWRISDEKLILLEKEVNDVLIEEKKSSSNELTNILTKAITDTKKRINRKEINKTSDLDSGEVNNKEAAYKNMKPKTTYLLGSPDNSDEEEEDEDSDQNEESQYLL